MKSSSSLKPEAYIKERARKLPIGTCIINHDWEEGRLANVLISRLHPQGTVTYGFYLVDLLCVGLKDTTFVFNESEEIFQETLSSFYEQEFVEIDYATAHNIIYASLEFGKENGFPPHKDFVITQYLLEEDNDSVPLVDIAIGGEQSGMPILVVNELNLAIEKRLIATLDKHVGRGEYEVYYVLEDEALAKSKQAAWNAENSIDDDLDTNEDDFGDDLSSVEFDDELHQETDDEYAQAYGNPDTSVLTLGVDFADFPVNNDVVWDYRDAQVGDKNMLDKIPPLGEATPESIALLEAEIAKYPHNIFLYSVLSTSYYFIGNEAKSEEVMTHYFNNNFDDFHVRVSHWQVLMDEGQLEEAETILNPTMTLDQIPLKLGVVSEQDRNWYFAMLARYAFYKKDVPLAQLVWNELSTHVEDDDAALDTCRRWLSRTKRAIMIDDYNRFLESEGNTLE